METTYRSRFLQLFGLGAFAVAWPFFQVLTKYPEFLIVHGSGPGELILIVFLALFPLPLVLWLIELAADKFSKPAGWLVHLILCGMLLALVALPPLGRWGRLPGVGPFVIAAIVGIVGALLLRRYQAARTYLSLSALAAPLFVLVFLIDPSIRRIAASRDLAAVSASGGQQPTPVVLVIFDCFALTQLQDTSMQIDPIRYPNFAGLAATSTFYPNLTTVSGLTLDSVSAILGGRYHIAGSRSTLADHPQNLFTITWDSHDRHVLELISQICPTARDDGVFQLRPPNRTLLLRDCGFVLANVLLPEGFRDGLPRLDQNWLGFGGAPIRNPWRNPHRDFRGWVDGIDTGERPQIYFAHVILPHDPYFFLPSGRRHDLPDDPNRAATWTEWGGGEWAIIHSQQRDLLQVGFVDLLLGELLQRLRDEQIFDDAMIVITGDHGISFRADGYRREMSDYNVFDILSVPLLIKYPGQTEGEISDLPAETIDILPTIADVLQIDLLQPVDGFSLLGEEARSRTHKRVFKEGVWEFELAVFDQLKESVQLKVSRFGEHSDEGLWEIGEEKALLGVRGALLSEADPGTRRVDFESPERFDNVNLDVDPLPLGLVGSVELRDADEIVPLAVTMNGEIVAVTRNYRDVDGRPTNMWTTILPERKLKARENQIELFEIEGDASSGYRLRRTRR